jgi:hypothetical protein
MNRILSAVSIFLLVFQSAIATSCQNSRYAYSITLILQNSVPDEKIYFQCYNGKSLVIIDSIDNSSAEKVFKGNKTLDPGIYSINIAQKSLANFLLAIRKNSSSQSRLT